MILIDTVTLEVVSSFKIPRENILKQCYLKSLGWIVSGSGKGKIRIHEVEGKGLEEG